MSIERPPMTPRKTGALRLPLLVWNAARLTKPARSASRYCNVQMFNVAADGTTPVHRDPAIVERWGTLRTLVARETTDEQ
jgi:hypothetical protein